MNQSIPQPQKRARTRAPSREGARQVATEAATLAEAEKFFESLLNKREFAAKLKVSTRTVDRMIAEGMPTHLFRGARRFDLVEALGWIRKKGS